MYANDIIYKINFETDDMDVEWIGINFNGREEPSLYR
jgi:hypothetical protein